jgi:hypothetical protein
MKSAGKELLNQTGKDGKNVNDEEEEGAEGKECYDAWRSVE